MVLERCEPGGSSVVHLEHELQPMGRPAGTLAVAIPPRGSVILDIAHEVVAPGQEIREVHFCYARVAERALPPVGDDGYALVLRAEGAGEPVRCKARLGGRRARLLELVESLAPAAEQN